MAAVITMLKNNAQRLALEEFKQTKVQEQHQIQEMAMEINCIKFGVLERKVARSRQLVLLP